jgi:hypothetical protein
MRLTTALLAAAVLATPALAEPITGKEARKLAFDPKGVEITITEGTGLNDQDLAILNQVLATQAYYGAVAMTPSEGILSEALVAAANYHDVDTARGVALSGCDARKREGSAPCIIVAELRPEGWEPRDLQLSAAATEGLRKEYKGFGAKAFALSASTGNWGVGKGDSAAQDAIAACNAAGAEDCAVVVAD